VHEPVADSVGQRGIADGVVPALDGALAGVLIAALVVFGFMNG